jgi:hypothetical protein
MHFGFVPKAAVSNRSKAAITSSALTSKAFGTARPSALAAFRLMANSNFGFSPFGANNIVAHIDAEGGGNLHAGGTSEFKCYTSVCDQNFCCRRRKFIFVQA